jgi:hypothetical protein
MKPIISFEGNSTISALCSATCAAFDMTMADKHKISYELLTLQGMSGRNYRKFINNLVGSIDECRYLEIGSWMGSTLCSALYKNDVTTFAIDNWSQFEGPQHRFFLNLSKFVNTKSKVNILNSDFRAVRYDSIGKHNIYLFDGPHEYQDQFDALAMVSPALDQEIVFIVDDWNWPHVRDGTLDAIRNTGWLCDYNIQIRSTDNDIHPGEQGLPADESSDWHNGYFIGVLRRA